MIQKMFYRIGLYNSFLAQMKTSDFRSEFGFQTQFITKLKFSFPADWLAKMI